jgi:hypothetical protein
MIERSGAPARDRKIPFKALHSSAKLLIGAGAVQKLDFYV